jgi:radical SAM enzyme (TIGR01210 family)
LFLTEKEAIDQAVETIDHAFAVGSTTVSLEAATIQDFTLMSYFYERGLYSPPWLWSILEVIKRARKQEKLIIGLFKFFPSPRVVPNNCNRCNKKVMAKIIEYNRTLDPKVFNGLTCACKEQWRGRLKEKPLAFSKRLEPLAAILEELRSL